MHPRDALRLAEEHAAHVVATAVWHRGDCSWVGARPEVSAPAASVRQYGAIGFDLYGGTAGVALFLAASAAHCGVDGAADAAASGARVSLRAADDGRVPDGLFDGTAGIALSAQLAGDWLNDGALSRAGTRLLHRAARATPSGWDVVSGPAGVVIALAACGEGDPTLGREAARIAGSLVRRSVPTARGPAWSDGEETLPLCGLAHGAIGPALALCVAAEMFGFGDGVELARAAVGYEDSWFRDGNWPDLRGVPLGLPEVPREVTQPVAWCYGAVGEVLARTVLLRHGLLTDTLDERGRHRLHQAANTLAHAVADTSARDAGPSLCHGLAGIVDATIEGDRAGLPGLDPQAAAFVLAELELSHWEHTESDTPGLMLGRSGVGYTFLRLARPALPSVLMPLLS